ncbi:hypothetical protein C2S53_010575 [Perilla frutescens var. hirtella]|uniref:Ubiquitin-like protease family profile domain-containing protein n=1 Tax=Perilla frutescens var. hirtella TaxID=608512 RepID=A0AAD4JEE9_PERFH|nr:hypothetical protein C2S53_010575 [Perilla frutescens var. hirtella]
MYNKFTDKRLANHPPDYVKIANILVVYRILFCHDPSHAIDGWVWALVEDVDAWNSFPWGGYTFQMLMHFMSLIPRVRRAMGGENDGAYHCVDFSRFFDGHLDIQLMVPSADELLRPYFQSSEGESVLGVRYVAPRAQSKKKLLTDVACCVILRTCTRSSDVVGPSRPRRSTRTTQQQAPHTHRLIVEPDEDPRVSPPRVSRSKRPRRIEKESSREPEMPGRCPEESSDSWFDRFVDAIAGAVEDRVMRRRADTAFQGAHAPRGATPLPKGPTPPRGPTQPPPRGPTPQESPFHLLEDPRPLESPFRVRRERVCWVQAMTPRTRGGRGRDIRRRGGSSTGHSSVGQLSAGELSGSCLVVCPSRGVRPLSGTMDLLKRQDREKYVTSYVSFRQSESLFDKIEDYSREIDAEIIDDFILEVDSRGLTLYFALPIYLYLWWDPPSGMMDIIKGLGGIYEGPWTRADHVITICNVGGHHWVIMDDPNDIEVAEKRGRELVPLLHLLPRLLWSFGYWSGRSRPDSHCYVLKLDKSVPDQFVQFDGVSCGVYAMMYVD